VNWRNRIVADPNVLVGKPVIKGTRISVELVMDLLAGGYTPTRSFGSTTTSRLTTFRRVWLMRVK
jgi:hypothetical protein